MARGFGVRVEGVRELRRELRAMGHGLDDMRKVHGEVSDIVEIAAKATAPKRTGRLARTGRPSETATRARVTFGGSRAPYAGPIHWGWPARRIRPQPFAVDSARETEPVWVALYLAEINRLARAVRGAR